MAPKGSLTTQTLRCILAIEPRILLVLNADAILMLFSVEDEAMFMASNESLELLSYQRLQPSVN